MKSIFKELIIILLLILVIILVLGVFLYDYIPTNKVVPKVEKYEIPNIVKEELQETIQNENNEVSNPIVYEINGTDLRNYEKSKDYDKGKINPFSEEALEEENNNQISEINSNSNNEISTQNTQSTNDTSNANSNTSNNNTVKTITTK